MTRTTLLSIATGFSFMAGLSQSIADSPRVKVSDIRADEDTSVIIRKGHTGALGPEFEIVSGTSEILGDPAAGAKESYANWKIACAEWKRETKELNKDNHVLALNCNSPVRSQENHEQMYRSTGSYQLKVRLRDATRR